MATKIKKSRGSSKRAPAKKSFFKNRFVILFALFLVIALGAWGLIRSMAVPTDINLVESTGKLTTPTDPMVARIVDEKGCYYQSVQCVKAPCEPILVCPPTASQSPTSTIPSGCVSWFDGCNTCTVKNGVISGCTKKACKLDSNNQPKPYCIAYSGDIVSTPVPTAIPTIVPTATPTPSPTPSQILVTITNFSASTPCGVSHFKNYQFTCSLGAKHTINDNTCINLVDAVKRAKDLCQTNPK